MKPNYDRYKYSRIALWIGGPAALLIRVLTRGNTLIPILVIVASVVIGLVIDLVIRKA